MKLTCLVAPVLLLVACGETEECRDLRAMLESRKPVLGSARAQAGVFEKIEQRALAAEQQATKLLAELGFDQPESKIQEVLDARVKKRPGAKLVRGAQEVPTSDPEPGPVQSETVWTVSFKEKDPAVGFAYLNALIALPPLFKFDTVLKEKGRDEWKIEIVRATVEQIPIKIEPTPLPERKDPSAIKEQMGTCGAGELRAEIKKIDEEIDSLNDKAVKTTVLLPTSASWDGVRGRAELVRDTELQTRKVMRAFIDTMIALRLRPKAIGVEGSLVVFEVWGADKTDRPRIEKALIEKGLGEVMQKPESQPEGVVRIMVPNSIAEARRQRQEHGGKTPLHMPGQERELPADHPDHPARKAIGAEQKKKQP